MGLEARLKQLESKGKPANMLERRPDLDKYITHLGLVPAAVRELARSNGSSLVVAMCEMLGIDHREFKRELKKVANLVR